MFHNAKYDLEVLARAENGGFTVAPIADSMLASYALDAGRHGHGMDELAERHLGHRPIAYEEVTGSGKTRIPFARVPLARATAYAAEDADVTLRLWRLLSARLRPEGALALYEQVERRMIHVLAEMERFGIRVDGASLQRTGKEFAARMAEIERDIHRLAGRAFNVGSPKQLGEILFEEMGLKGGRKGKSGAWSTDASVLEDLAAQGVELAARVLEWRQLQKLVTTYVEGLSRAIAADGRVHTDYTMAVASTGRLSSTEPNLQNIPVRTPRASASARPSWPIPAMC